MSPAGQNFEIRTNIHVPRNRHNFENHLITTLENYVPRNESQKLVTKLTRKGEFHHKQMSSRDPLKVPVDPVTRLGTKRFKEGLLMNFLKKILNN